MTTERRRNNLWRGRRKTDVSAHDPEFQEMAQRDASAGHKPSGIARLAIVFALISFAPSLYVAISLDDQNEKLRKESEELARVAAKNRAGITALCATTKAIRNLDAFLRDAVLDKKTGKAIRIKGQTEEQYRNRQRFLNLVQGDLARMKAAGDSCALLKNDKPKRERG